MTVGATQLGGSAVSIALRLDVASIAIPDWPTFVVDLNGYTLRADLVAQLERAPDESPSAR